MQEVLEEERAPRAAGERAWGVLVGPDHGKCYPGEAGDIYSILV